MQTIEIEKEVNIFIEEPTSFYEELTQSEAFDLFDFSYSNESISYDICNLYNNALIYGQLIDRETNEVLHHWEEEIDYKGCIQVFIPLDLIKDFNGFVRIGLITPDEEPSLPDEEPSLPNEPNSSNEVEKNVEDEKNNKEEIVLQ